MQRVAAATFSALAATAGANEASPVGKVLQLLSDLQAKVIKEGEVTQQTYQEYSEWCEDRARDLTHEKKIGSQQVDELKASIADSSATAQALTAKIDGLAGDIATDEADLKAATEIRSREQSDFKAEEADLTGTISMLERAAQILEREMAKGGASALQLHNAQSFTAALSSMVEASMMSSADAQRLTALTQISQASAEDETEPGAPAAAVYQSQSGDIADTLRDLLEKAEAQLADARKAETKNVQNFEMLVQSLKDELRFANKDMTEAKRGLSQAGEAQASAEGDLAAASKELAADTEAKAELHQDCMSRAEDFEAETKSRGEELKALAAAKKVLSETSGGATGIVYGGESFLQTASGSRLASSADLKGLEAVRMVRDLARREHSAVLAQLAARMATARRSVSSDPFSKIKGLIADMITRLEDEHAADADRKEYCDKELKESRAKKAEKTAEADKLTNRVDRHAARSVTLKGHVKELQQQLAKLAGSQAQMDKLRAEESDEFKKNKADMEMGLDGVKMALKVLNEYYAKADKDHGAAEGAGAGVIGLLEVVESDFSKSLAEIQSTEEAAAADYDKETKENDVERAAKSTGVAQATKEFKYLDGEVKTISADRDNVQAELDAAHEYLSSMESQCAEKVESYADRKAHRQAEIAGLKEALQTLESETALVQTRHRSFRGISKHA